jgi:hypothetical protein
MLSINWDEFKLYKKQSHKDDNFEILLDFIGSYYNIKNPSDVYEILLSDATAELMLKKRNIVDAVALETYRNKL